MLIGDVSDLLENTSANRVANLLGCRFGMNISKIPVQRRQTSLKRLKKADVHSTIPRQSVRIIRTTRRTCRKNQNLVETKIERD